MVEITMASFREAQEAHDFANNLLTKTQQITRKRKRFPYACAHLQNIAD